MKKMVTYIRNGLEKTISFNFFQELKLLGICSFCVDDISKKLVIDDNIEFIHFKNVIFKNLNEVISDINTVCIFENCVFKTSKISNFDIVSIDFEGGEFELVNCFFNSCYIVHGSDTLSFNVIYNNNIKNNYSLNFNAGDKSFGCPGKILIKDQNNISKINVYADEVYLQDNFELDCLSLMGENITIGNSFNETIIKSTEYPYDTKIIADEELNLCNCSIDNSCKNSNLKINGSRVIVNNVTIKSKGPIILKGSTYFSKDNDEVIITDLDINRANFIQLLKGYSKYLEKKNILKATNMLQEDYEELEKKKKQLYQEYLLLLKVEEEKEKQLSSKKEMITKCLAKRKVKDIK